MSMDINLAVTLKQPLGELSLTKFIAEVVTAINSKDPQRQLLGIQQVCQLACHESNPPIDLMIGHGIVPICVRFLYHNSNDMLKFEAALILTNIAAGTSEQTRCVIDENAVPLLVYHLQSDNIKLAEQAAWALGNIAGDGAEARDIVIQHNVISGIPALINKGIPLSLLRIIGWLMVNLCRHKNPSLSLEQVERLLPMLSEFLVSKDSEVQFYACFAMTFVAHDDIDKLQPVIVAKIVLRLVHLLKSVELHILNPALRCVGHIVAGTDQQTDMVIADGALQTLGRLLENYDCNIVELAAWTVSNITAGNQAQIQAVIDSGIFQQICQLLVEGNFKARKQAAFAVSNTTISGTYEQVVDLIDKFKIFKPFVALLHAPDPLTIIVVQSGLSNLFDLAKKLGDPKDIFLIFEQLGGLDKLEKLQLHESKEIYKNAYDIISKYFSEAEEDLEPLNDGPINDGLEFNPTQHRTPDGGYSI